MNTRVASPLNRNLRLITVAGCLAMVYSTAISSPLTTEFFRHLGATDLHFGLLGGVPLIMLIMQFLGAYLSNRVRRRKPWFIVCAVVSRLLYLPLAILPLLLRDRLPEGIVPVMILIIALSGALGNLTVPLWLSWMSDLIPRRILNRYWGERQRQMTLVWAFAFVATAALTYAAGTLPVTVTFAVLIGIGCIAGVLDILLFIKVREPENLTVHHLGLVEELLEPLRHRDYRSLVRYSCSFAVATMMASAFMQVYVLKVLEVAVWKTILIWCMAGLGNAMVARAWGGIADRHGHRPVLLICTLFKPFICLAFLVVTPRTAVPVLGTVFFLDSMFNSGNAIATNGFMLKTAPRENRSTFIAAVTSLAGIAGGLSAIGAGFMLRHTEGLTLTMLGRTWTNYHLLFLVSFVLRVLCVPLAATVREPDSAPAAKVLTYMMGIWPLRILTFPVGLYRRIEQTDDPL